MPDFSLDRIVGVLRDPFLDPTRYEVVITGPVEVSREMSFNCKVTGIPSHNIGSFEHSVIGPKRKIPNEELFDDLSMSFYTSESFKEMDTIFRWMKMIGGGDSYRMAYYSDIVADINIDVYDLREGYLATIKFAEAYPIGVTEYEIGYAATYPAEITVSWAYHTYEIVPAGNHG